MGFGIKKEAGSNTTPSDIVNFDKLTPTTAGVVFDPNTPATEDILYVSSVDASTWIWNGAAYITYSPPATATTEWYLAGTTIDAGSNKTAAISRNNAIYTIGYDSFFNSVRIGRGNNNIATNTVVGSGAGGAISTGSGNSFFGANSGRINSIGNFNSFFGTYAGYSNTFGNSNTFIGNSAGYFNTVGSANLFLGKDSGFNNTEGSNNAFLGVSSAFNNTTGSNNAFLGVGTGRFAADGVTPVTIVSNSVYLGRDIRSLANNQTNEIVIGYNAIGKGTNTVNIGNTSITDSYINGIVHVSNTWVLPTTAPTSGQVLGYLGAGTTQWLTSGGGGIWGISNASGVYTYYATWALAVAVATSGQCIELFADITETTVSYILKNGVNVNGNGHTITFASATDGFVLTVANTVCEINNITINQATGGVSGLYINSTGTNVVGGNAIFKSTNASSNGVYGRTGVTRIYGFTCNGYNPIFVATFFSPNAIIDNVYVNMISGIVTTGTLSNSTISSTSGTPIGACSVINNCYVYANGSFAISATSNMEINNSTIISVTSRAINGAGPFTFNNCWIKSFSDSVFGLNTVTFNNCSLIASTTPLNSYLGSGNFNNCTLIANASAVLSAYGGGLISNCNVICNYNNAGGHAFSGCNGTVTNSVIQVANSSAFAFTGTNTMYLSNNGIKGTTNFKSAGITNAQTNTADAQGNVILN